MRIRLSQGYVFLALALLFVLLSRIPYLSLGVFDPDEAVGVMVAQSILEGGLPYVDAIDHRGPLSYFFFAGIFAVAGPLNLTAVHQALLLLLLGNTLLIFLLAKRAFSQEVAGWAVLIFAVLSWMGKPTDLLAAHTEWLAGFWTLLGLWLWLRKKEAQVQHALIGGICIGIAALSKQVAVWEWLVFPLAMGLLAQRGSLRWPFAIGQIIYAGIGFALPLLVFMLAYAVMGHWDAFYTYAWQYNVDIYMPALGWGRRLRNSWDLLLGFSLGKTLLLGLSVAGGGMLVRKEMGKVQTLLPPVQLILGVWAGLAFMGSLTGGRNFGHYLIQALPGLALLGGFALGEIQRLSKQSFVLTPLLISLAALGILLPIPTAYGLYYKPWIQARETSAIKDLTTYLRPFSQTDKSLFVWGFAPHYYAETGLRPASRFLYTTFQTGVVPIENAHLEQVNAFVMEESWQPLWEDLKASPPDFVLDAAQDDYSFMGWHPISRYPELQAWVDQHYVMDSTYHIQFPDHQVLLYRKKEVE